MSHESPRSRVSLDNLELRLLSYFNAVAEFGSISRAAAALHLTQPTLSRQLAQLEVTVGFQLFLRTARGAVLTPAGEALRAHAEVLAAQVARIPEVLRESSREKHVVTIGLPSGMPDEWFLTFRSELAARAPHVALSLHDMNTPGQRTMLSNQSLDVGLMHSEPPELPSQWMFRQPLGFALREAHAAIARSSLSFEDMDGQTVLAQSSSSERTRLKTQTLQHGASIEWRFRSFATHSRFIADAAGADAVLLTQATAARSFPDWEWRPIVAAEGALHLHSWAAWWDKDSPVVTAVREAMAAAAVTPSQTGLYDGSPPAHVTTEI